MAGRARHTAIADELDKRCRHYFEDDEPSSHLDYVAARLADGVGLKAHAADLSKTLGLDISYEMLLRYLARACGGEACVDQALDAARARASHGLAEESVSITDEPAFDGAQVSRNASRSRSRQWMAAQWNQARYGPQKAASVSINIGTLHLSALQSPAGREAILLPHGRSDSRSDA